MNDNDLEAMYLEPTSAPLYGSRILDIDQEDASVPESPTTLFQYRSIDGTGNNPYHYYAGAGDTQLLRLLTPAYEDGISTPRGGSVTINSPFGPFSIPDPDGLPNPRTISNTVAKQTESIPNFLGASDWLWQWGQFLDHDLDLNEGGQEAFFIPVHESDSLFNPHFPYLPFTRVPAAAGTGTSIENPREQKNEITSYIDGSGVYGSDEDRASFLRTFEQGRLKTTFADNGEQMLPYNRATNPFANAKGGLDIADESLYMAGDVRANEQIGLTANHVLFVREHNRLAGEILSRLEAGESSLVDQYQSFKADYRQKTPGASEETVRDAYLYQAARKVVGAQIQIITYKEFLPILIGDTLLDDYQGYKPYINPSVSNEFANAAYRLGHTLLNNQVNRLSDNGLSSITLSDAFFNPEEVSTHGVDSLLRGLILQEAQELDNFIVDGVRDFLFPAGTGGLDLASVNIQRGREVGLPSYVETYKQLFGTEITSFEELPFAPAVIELFQQAYDDVGEIDLWLGGISELSANHGGLLGPTFSFFIKDQFARAAAGDRFFFLNDLNELSVLVDDITDTTLSDVIRRNTSQGYLVQDNSFQVPFENTIIGDNAQNSLRGTRKNDLIDGQDGNDFIRGDFGNDILLGNLGSDYLMGGHGADTVMGGDGNDVLAGNYGNDILVAGNGNDMVRGGNGQDILNGVGDEFGRHDFDILNGGGEADTFILGDERSIYYKEGGLAIIQNFELNQDTVELAGSAADYTLMSFGSRTSLRLAANNDLIAIFDANIENFNIGFKFV